MTEGFNPFAPAWAALQAGRAADAERLGRAALQTTPDSAEGWFLVGAACQSQDRSADAVECYARALHIFPDFPEARNNLGNGLRRLGRLADAESCYRQALRLRPDYPEAYNNLGNVLRDLGQPAPAVECYAQALRLRPDVPEILVNIGNALRDLGRFQDAAERFRRVLERRPDYPEAHFYLGNVLQDLGLLTEAADSFRHALHFRPDYLEALLNLGNILQDQYQPGEAAECFHRATTLRPDLPEVHYNLANALHDHRRLAEAVACYRHALALRPDFAAALVNLGNALRDLGRPEEALEPLRRALGLCPDSAEAQTNLGAALYDLGRLDEAVDCYRHALRHRPDLPEAHANLGGALRDLGRLTEAEEALRRALALRPDYAEAHKNLGHIFQDQGRLDEAEASFHRALELRPGMPGLLMLLHYRAGVTPKELAAAHADFDHRYTAPLRTTWRPHNNDRSPDRPLRLGFVSPDFRSHPVGFLLVRVVEALARRPTAILCYSNHVPTPDDLTARFQAAASAWREIRAMSDDALAEQIRGDRVDVLIDLAGHTAANRLLVFARKPAPVQATWLGYVGTTGLEAMDYLIADRYEVPEGAEVHYRERVLRLPGGYASFDPPADAPKPGPPPALASGRVTFGCFNNPAKLSPPTVVAFAAVLRQVPGARLVLKYRGFDDPTLAARLRAQFAAAGVEPERVELHGGAARAEFVAAYREIDIALDSFPFAGGVTTCEALWMGVPVVTLPGATFASRHGLSHLSSVGLADELAARDVDDYVARAVGLAQDLGRLATLRSGLRERLGRSPLCDGDRVADELLQALRGAWRTWAMTT
jgi:predicted O-linked N-acetylglucosamine transferase (SPINDLY family)